MDINMNRSGREVSIRLAGDVDELAADELENLFTRIAPDETDVVTFDFGGIRYIGSAGVGMLLLLYKRLAPHNARVVICNIPKEIHRMFTEDMNLGQVFTLSRA